MGNPRLVKYRTPLICLALAVATFIAFEQVRNNDFVSYDDESYVTDNPNVNKGLSLKSVVWAFTTPHRANWNPVTQISHMLDCQALLSIVHSPSPGCPAACRGEEWRGDPT